MRPGQLPTRLQSLLDDVGPRNVPTPAARVKLWRVRAERYRERGFESQARLLDDLADELALSLYVVGNAGEPGL